MVYSIIYIQNISMAKENEGAEDYIKFKKIIEIIKNCMWAIRHDSPTTKNLKINDLLHLWLSFD